MDPSVSDVIEVRSLRIRTRIGVPDAERSESQTLLVDLRMTPPRNFDRMPDELSSTVDYHAVSVFVETLAASKPRLLIETLADEIAAGILANFGVLSVHVRIRKFILPNTEYVAVACERKRSA